MFITTDMLSIVSYQHNDIIYLLLIDDVLIKNMASAFLVNSKVFFSTIELLSI